MGGKIIVKTIHGEMEIKISPGTNDGEIKKINNHGVSKLAPNENQRGHHFVKIKIKIPKKINSMQKRIFEELSKYDEDN